MVGEALLDQCFRAVLDQSFADFELLIVVDGRNERVGEIQQLGDRDSRVRIVISDPFKARTAALSACIAQAKGEYIKFVCPADILHAQCLEKFVQAFRLCRTLSLASCAYEWEPPGSITPSLWRNEYPSQVISGRAIVKKDLWVASDFVGNLSASFFKRDFGVSGLDERFFNLGELDFWLRLLTQGDYLFIQEPLCAIGGVQIQTGDSFNMETLLACHDYIILADNFSQFMASEKVDARAFIDATRAAMESEFRRTFGNQDTFIADSKRIAHDLAQSQTDLAERSFTLECYIRLCYELLLCYGHVRGAVMNYREQLASVAKNEDEQAMVKLRLSEKSKSDELIELQEKYRQVCDERQSMVSSGSWRVTEPIRFLYSSVKRFVKKSQTRLSIDNT
jgi:hypothetical protein